MCLKHQSHSQSFPVFPCQPPPLLANNLQINEEQDDVCFCRVALYWQLCLMKCNNRGGGGGRCQTVRPGQLGISELEGGDLPRQAREGAPLSPGDLEAQEFSINRPEVWSCPADHDGVGAETNQSERRKEASSKF